MKMREFLWIILFFSVFDKLKGNANIDDHLVLFDSIFGTPDDEEVQSSCDTSKLEDQLNKTIEKMTNMEKTIQRLSELTIGMSVEEYTLTNNCPGGWTYYSETDSCFKTITDKLGWVDAKTRCESFGSNLASVTTAQENKYIRGLFGGNEGIWIGLNDRKSENHFEWVDGTPFTPNVFAGWSNPSPYDEHEDCVALWRDITWNDASCNLFKFASVCKKPVKQCPNGWTEYQQTGACFFIQTSSYNWYDAKKYCELAAVGSQLASIWSYDENQFVRDLLNSRGITSSVWLGGNDIESEGYWVWSDNSRVTFFDWAIGEPNNDGGTQDCLSWKSYDGWKWDDNWCNNVKQISVCKIP